MRPTGSDTSVLGVMARVVRARAVVVRAGLPAHEWGGSSAVGVTLVTGARRVCRLRAFGGSVREPAANPARARWRCRGSRASWGQA